MKNKNGFTLIELLVTITLMLSLLGIAIVSFIEVSNNRKEQAWDKVQDQMKEAAKVYFDSKEYLLSGKDSARVSIGMLVSDDYLNVVTNPVTGKTLNKCSYIEVTKNGSSYNYEYNESNDTSCQEDGYLVLQEAGAPSIDVTMSNSPTGNNNWYVKKDVFAKAKVNTNGNGPIKEVKYCTSNDENCNEYTFLALSNDNKYSGGTQEGKNYAIFVATNTSNKSVTGYVSYQKDTINPTCSSNNGTKAWTNKTRTITWNCDDKGSGCVKNTYSKTFESSTTTGSIKIKDNAGNENNCSANVYVDKSKPGCTLSLTGTKGNKVNKLQWYKSDVTINATFNDTGGSGISQKGLDTKKGSTNGKTTDTQTTEINEVTWNGYVKDNAGNENSCNTTFGLEKNVTLTFNADKTNNAKSYNPGNLSNGKRVFNTSEDSSVCVFNACENINCRTDQNKKTSCPKNYFARACMYVNDYDRYFNVSAVSYEGKGPVKADGKEPTPGMERVKSISRYNNTNKSNKELFKYPYYYNDIGDKSGGRSALTAHIYQYTSPAGNESNEIQLFVEYIGNCGY